VRSELEAGFTRRLSKRLDPSVILKPGTIEGDLLDSGLPGTLGNQLPNRLGGTDVTTVRQLLRTSGSSDEAAARTLVPQAEITCA
jgi:hypothetical protein